MGAAWTGAVGGVPTCATAVGERAVCTEDGAAGDAAFAPTAPDGAVADAKFAVGKVVGAKAVAETGADALAVGAALMASDAPDAALAGGGAGGGDRALDASGEDRPDGLVAPDETADPSLGPSAAGAAWAAGGVAAFRTSAAAGFDAIVPGRAATGVATGAGPGALGGVEGGGVAVAAASCAWIAEDSPPSAAARRELEVFAARRPPSVGPKPVAAWGVDVAGAVPGLTGADGEAAAVAAGGSATA